MYCVLLVAAALITGCSGGDNQTGQDVASDQVGTDAASTSAEGASSPPAAPTTTPSGTFSGEVAETMNAAGYTYMLLDTGTEKVWIAGPETEVSVGERVSVGGGMLMQEFTSGKLERTFESIWFVPAIVSGDPTTVTGDKSTGLPAGHPELPTDSPHDFDVSAGIGSAHVKVGKQENVELIQAEGGQTIAQIHARKDALVGNEVVVRGQVVKFTPEVMGKNWLHIQDGSGEGETADLTVTTAATVKVGDVVLIRGQLTTDKDFGYGYHYAVIVEDAKVTVE
jgi:hypothetical protein